MNYLQKRVFAFFFMSNLLISPIFLYAQVNALNSSDGSNESTTTRREHIRGWRLGSSELQQKISTLASTSSLVVLMPVLFGVETRDLSPNFGDTRSNGRTHLGEDIMAIKGTPIVSPTDAVVLRVGVGAGEGNYIYTANPGGETFVYMHLDKFGEGVSVGSTLQKGDLLGYVGNTGNASGGPAHLHFEIHDSNGAAIDPFPRLSSVFTLEEKNIYVTKILTQTNDSNSLATLLVTYFRSTFTQIQSSLYLLPPLITQYMASLPNMQTGESVIKIILPNGDLSIGSQGAAVTHLQNYLIAKNSGREAARLADAGATGYFGSITQSALIEYQKSVSIIPSDGYYGQTTRILVEASLPPIPTISSNTEPTPKNNIPITRNLYLGVEGEDVLSLQKFLNTHGYIVAQSGSGSIGNETTYFGKATAVAVMRFQAANTISPAVGYVGPLTRALLLSLNV